jgi:hypothetical protein
MPDEGLFILVAHRKKAGVPGRAGFLRSSENF